MSCKKPSSRESGQTIIKEIACDLISEIPKGKTPITNVGQQYNDKMKESFERRSGLLHLTRKQGMC